MNRRLRLNWTRILWFEEYTIDELLAEAQHLWQNAEDEWEQQVRPERELAAASAALAVARVEWDVVRREVARLRAHRAILGGQGASDAYDTPEPVGARR